MNTPVTPSIWLMLDDRASHRSQVMGVAERLGWPADQREIRYNALARVTNRLLGATSWHLDNASREALRGPWPQLAIAAGRRSAPLMLALRQVSPRTRLVQLMWPDCNPAPFDLIAIPDHDSARRQGPNILRTFGSPHRVLPSKLNMEAARWHNFVARLPRPRIALLIGGSAKGGIYGEADFRMLAAYASAEAERLGGSLLITSSPRTGSRGEELVKSILTVPNFFHQWKEGSDNPYIGFLGLADAIIATGDSVSMCSEACSTGKPVYIFVPPHLTEGHRGFRDALFAGNHAKPSTYPIRMDWQPTPLQDAATAIAEAIQTRLFPTFNK